MYKCTEINVKKQYRREILNEIYFFSRLSMIMYYNLYGLC